MELTESERLATAMLIHREREVAESKARFVREVELRLGLADGSMGKTHTLDVHAGKVVPIDDVGSGLTA